MAKPAGDGNERDLTSAIATEFRRRLLGEYVPRIRRCAGLLGDVVWERPGPTCNSVGNLVMHLTGNTRQWILSALGGCEDQRDRPGEFSARGETEIGELLDELERVVEEACELVAALPPTEWHRRRTVQGHFDESGLSIVLHVLEHFSGHAGQIYAWTKQRLDTDLAFYDI